VYGFSHPGTPNVYWDFLKAQSEELAYQHAMRAPWETVDTASMRYNAFLNQNRKIGRLLPGLGVFELQALGKNLHALADNESPAHTGFQQWFPPFQKGDLNDLHQAIKQHEALEANPSPAKVWEVAQILRNEYCRYFSIYPCGPQAGNNGPGSPNIVSDLSDYVTVWLPFGP
jgi:hypothetical protein